MIGMLGLPFCKPIFQQYDYNHSQQGYVARGRLISTTGSTFHNEARFASHGLRVARVNKAAWRTRGPQPSYHAGCCPSVTCSIAAPGAEDVATAAALERKFALSASTGALDLSDCGLSEVPPEVWELTDLEDLSLAGNRIRALPPGIGNLRQLRRLGLAGNLLRELPPEIGRLQALEGLWLHGNLLHSLPEQLGALSNLRMLALAGNQLTALPASIGQLSSLQVLSVAGNELQTIPAAIGGLERLKVLALYGNRLRQLPSEIAALAALQDLWLQGNRLETLPPDLGGLLSLRQLSLADNCLRTLPESLARLPSLHTLWLYGNQVQELPASLGKAGSLSNLWMESNPLDGGVLAQLLPSLDHLKVIGIDSDQAAGLPAEVRLRGKNLSIGRIAGTGAARTSGGYFKIQPWAPQDPQASNGEEEAAPVLVVAFGSAPGVPNWGGLLRKVRQAMASGNPGPCFDVLYVVDPARSWYTHGPLSAPPSSQPPAAADPPAPRMASSTAPLSSGGSVPQRTTTSSSSRRTNLLPAVTTAQVGGASQEEAEDLGAYYGRELEAAVRGYRRVVLLGDSMGASAALRFSWLATAALAFCPQVDLSTASIRPGRGEEWHVAFRDTLLRAVEESAAQVAVHCGNWCHDVEQAQMVGSAKVDLTIHPITDHRLAKELDTHGELAPIIMNILVDELNQASE